MDQQTKGLSLITTSPFCVSWRAAQVGTEAAAEAEDAAAVAEAADKEEPDAVEEEVSAQLEGRCAGRRNAAAAIATAASPLAAHPQFPTNLGWSRVGTSGTGRATSEAMRNNGVVKVARRLRGIRSRCLEANRKAASMAAPRRASMATGVARPASTSILDIGQRAIDARNRADSLSGCALNVQTETGRVLGLAIT